MSLFEELGVNPDNIKFNQLPGADKPDPTEKLRMEALSSSSPLTLGDNSAINWLLPWEQVPPTPETPANVKTDANGRVVSVTYSTGQFAGATAEFKYDSQGNLDEVIYDYGPRPGYPQGYHQTLIKQNGQWVHEDAGGNVLSVPVNTLNVQVDSSGNVIVTMQAAGFLITETTHPDGSRVDLNDTTGTTTKFATAGNPQEVDYANGTKLIFSTDGSGNQTVTIDQADGSSTTIYGITGLFVTDNGCVTYDSMNMFGALMQVVFDEFGHETVKMIGVPSWYPSWLPR